MKMEGYVRDADTGESLPLANVAITDAAGNSTGQGDSANVAGYYEVNGEPWQYITVSYVGYENQTLPFLGGRRDLSLAPQSYLLDEIVIRPDEPHTLEKVLFAAGLITAIFLIYKYG